MIFLYHLYVSNTLSYIKIILFKLVDDLISWINWYIRLFLLKFPFPICIPFLVGSILWPWSGWRTIKFSWCISLQSSSWRCDFVYGKMNKFPSLCFICWRIFLAQLSDFSLSLIDGFSEFVCVTMLYHVHLVV